MINNLIDKALNKVENVGNKLPDPTTIFIILTFGILAVSWLFSFIGVSAVHPATKETILIENLLSSGNIQRIFTEMVHNFANFPPLGMVLVTVVGIGIAEKSGLIDTALKKLVTAVPKSALTATLVFGGITSSMAADAGYIVLTPLGAVLFAGFGRHPLAGLAAAFAGVSAGFSANLLLTSLDPLLSGLSTTSAQIVDPNYVVHPTANYYFMVVSTFLLTIVGTLVTDKIVEPRLGKWEPKDAKLDTTLGNISQKENKGLILSIIAFITFMVITAIMVIPEGAILRDAQGGLGPFYKSLVPLIMILFLVCGLVYGITAGTIKSDKDAVGMANEYMATMAAYIILSFVAAQFVTYFSWSNMGIVSAIKGAGLLQTIGLSGIPLMVGFIFVTGTINIFIGSASAKWAIMGPVFIPMFMLMGFSPEMVQNVYRVGDSVTNIISPLLPYFPIIIAFAKKYDPKIGLGTLISTMLPYSVAFALMWSVVLVIWMLTGIPLGPEASSFYDASQLSN
ncbi:MAG: AbgT family transporter, partial [Bacteriovoracaceae bacterium]|nr:AbgT family transporter [Bacteriovoracaceae bacterium]